MNNTTSHQGRFKSLRAAVDLRNEKNGYKIREATLQKVPYLLVIGEQEKAGAASPCWGVMRLTPPVRAIANGDFWHGPGWPRLVFGAPPYTG